MPQRALLDGIEWTIIKDVSTRNLAFVAGKGDLVYTVTIPKLKEVYFTADAVIAEFAKPTDAMIDAAMKRSVSMRIGQSTRGEPSAKPRRQWLRADEKAQTA